MVHQGLKPADTGPRGRRLLQRRGLLAGGVAAAALAACAVAPHRPGPPPPALPREFRAAWVATVANIDWPSRPGLPTARARAEMHTLLDRAAAIGLNALVLQVRPAADALYSSPLEPWSEYLTGASGQPPDVAWDPLAEWVAGAHARGLELHAWFNPYRARHPSARSPDAATHVATTEPALVKRYGDFLWMDPGEPRAAQRMLDVVLDVVRRYDVDGVHIDDYFYPYPVNDAGGTEVPFPDDGPWQRYRAAGGVLTRDDWRRDNVDRLVQALHEQVHAAKPWVRLGVSPFGLPRPDRRPPGISGFSQYDKLYADVERWLDEGWLDYLAPQLYWPIAQTAQAFAPLQAAWHAGNRQGRHVWPGLFTSRLGAERNAYTADEVLAQVALTRGAARAASAGAGSTFDGHLHFSMAALLQDRDGVATRLRAGPYATPALAPPTPWLAEPAPAAPHGTWARGEGGARVLRATPGGDTVLRQVVLWQRRGDAWTWQVLPAARAAVAGFAVAAGADALWLQALGRTGLASPPQPVPP